MSLGIRWALVVLVVAYGLSTLAAVENFNEMIAETQHDQQQLSSEIQTQLDIQKEKTPEGTISKETIASEGFKIILIKNTSRN